MRTDLLLSCAGMCRRLPTVLSWLPRSRILRGPKHGFLPTVGTERTTTNTIVPLRSAAQGRTRLIHAFGPRSASSVGAALVETGHVQLSQTNETSTRHTAVHSRQTDRCPGELHNGSLYAPRNKDLFFSISSSVCTSYLISVTNTCGVAAARRARTFRLAVGSRGIRNITESVVDFLRGRIDPHEHARRDIGEGRSVQWPSY